MRNAVSASSKRSSPASRAGFQHRLQPLADGEAAVREHDLRRDCSLPDAAWPTATRFSAIEVRAGDDRQPVRARTPRGCARSAAASSRVRSNCRRAPWTPASARSPSAARRGRRTTCRAFPWSSWRRRATAVMVSASPSSTSRSSAGVEHLLLARGQRLAVLLLDRLQHVSSPQRPTAKLSRAVPYVTVRLFTKAGAGLQGLTGPGCGQTAPLDLLQPDRPNGSTTVPATIEASNCGAGVPVTASRPAGRERRGEAHEVRLVEGREDRRQGLEQPSHGGLRATGSTGPARRRRAGALDGMGQGRRVQQRHVGALPQLRAGRMGGVADDRQPPPRRTRSV